MNEQDTELTTTLIEIDGLTWQVSVDTLAKLKLWHTEASKLRDMLPPGEGFRHARTALDTGEELLEILGLLDAVVTPDKVSVEDSSP